MKKQLLIFLVFMAAAISGISQSAYFGPKITKDSISPTNINYHLKLGFSGITIPLQYYTINTVINQTYFGDSIPNLASRSLGTDSMPYISYAINLSNTLDTVGKIHLIPKRKPISYISHTTNTPGNCNGSITLNIYPGQAGFSVLALNNSFLGIIQSGTHTLPNLCEGKYQITTANPPQIYEWNTFILGLSYMPTASTMSVTVNPYENANGASCTGKAGVSVSGGVPPYSYSFDYGQTFSSTDSVTGLCAGIHVVTIADAQDTIAKNFVISDYSHTYSNTNSYGSVADTIVIYHADCSFDYDTPIDSAYIDDYYLLSQNEMFISIHVWQAGNLTSINDTINYPFMNDSTYMVSLVIYCGNQRALANTFTGKRINDYVYANLSVTGILAGQKTSAVVVYPNPFKDELTVKIHNQSGINNISTMNVLGEQVALNLQKNATGFHCYTTHLPPGVYFITILFANGERSSVKMLKD